MINYEKILNKNLINVLIDILKEIKNNGLKGNNHLYITFITNHPSVYLPKWLLKKYPEKMTIIIQYEYFNFSVNKNNFKIGLSFNDVKADLNIGYNSIISFADPHANFGLMIKQNENIELNSKNLKNKKLKYNKKKNLNNVIDFNNYKKN